MTPISIIVGFDQREAVAYHVFCQSVIDTSSVPVSFTPLSARSLGEYEERHKDGSNAFTYSRFLTPHLMGFKGWAIYADGDMICRKDIAKLWELRDSDKAVLVAKHNYVSKAKKKYLGSINEDYPRKNWSSLILWNCEHPKNRQLTPSFIGLKSGSFLHRFKWLEDSDIGDIPLEWNWLATEYPPNEDAKLIHYTLGTPCFKDYRNSDMAEFWDSSFSRLQEGF